MSITIFQNNRFSYIEVREGRMGGGESGHPWFMHEDSGWTKELENNELNEMSVCFLEAGTAKQCLLEGSLSSCRRLVLCPTFHP